MENETVVEEAVEAVETKESEPTVESIVEDAAKQDLKKRTIKLAIITAGTIVAVGVAGFVLSRICKTDEDETCEDQAPVETTDANNSAE